MTIAERIANRIKDMPVSFRKLYKSCIDGKASPRMVIKYGCVECMGWEKEEVRICDNQPCQNWLYRPYRMVKKRSTRVDLGNSSPAGKDLGADALREQSRP